MVEGGAPIKVLDKEPEDITIDDIIAFIFDNKLLVNRHTL